MKNYFLRLCFTILISFLIGCKGQNNYESPKFSFGEKSYLRFHIINCKAPANFLLVYNTIFPHDQKTNEYLFRAGYN